MAFGGWARELRVGFSGSLFLHCALLVLLITGISFNFSKPSKPGEVLGKAYQSNDERRITFSILPRVDPQTDLAKPAHDSGFKSADPISGIPLATPKPDLFVLPSRQKSAFARAITIPGDGSFSQSEALAEVKKIFNYQRAADFLAAFTDSLQRGFPDKSQIQCSFRSVFSCEPRASQVQAFFSSHAALFSEYRIQTAELVRDVNGTWSLHNFSLREELP